ncbi:hypothetical protein ACFL09_05650 [Planctomycetota bacterium]
MRPGGREEDRELPSIFPPLDLPGAEDILGPRLLGVGLDPWGPLVLPIDPNAPIETEAQRHRRKAAEHRKKAKECDADAAAAEAAARGMEVRPGWAGEAMKLRGQAAIARSLAAVHRQKAKEHEKKTTEAKDGKKLQMPVVVPPPDDPDGPRLDDIVVPLPGTEGGG